CHAIVRRFPATRHCVGVGCPGRRQWLVLRTRRVYVRRVTRSLWLPNALCDMVYRKRRRRNVKPAPFDYHRAYSIDESVEMLAELGDDAKILAGGQSLAPMMNFRLARPSALIDINSVRGMDYITRDGDELGIGAMTRHRAIETTRSPDVLNGFGFYTRAPWCF